MACADNISAVQNEKRACRVKCTLYTQGQEATRTNGSTLTESRGKNDLRTAWIYPLSRTKKQQLYEDGFMTVGDELLPDFVCGVMECEGKSFEHLGKTLRPNGVMQHVESSVGTEHMFSRWRRGSRRFFSRAST